MTFEEVLVTKEMADAMLAHNTNNYRSVKWRVVHRYSRAMANGMWRENGEPIVFDEDGVLKDGQHRLLAILESGVSVKMLIVRGISRDVTTFDEGSNRSVADKAKAEGMCLSPSAIGAAGMIIAKFNERNIYISQDEKFQYGWDHLASLKKAQSLCAHGAIAAVMKRAACIAAVYCAIELKLMPDDALDAFCTIVNNGMPKGEYVPDSALALRNTVLEGVKKPDGGYYVGCSLNKPLFEITWQAMVAFKEGRKPRRKYVPSGCGEKVIERLEETQKGAVA